MPYCRKADLPETLRQSIPPAAQELYRQAFNRAWWRYGASHGATSSLLEAIAHQIATASLEQTYHRNEKGRWVADKAPLNEPAP